MHKLNFILCLFMLFLLSCGTTPPDTLVTLKEKNLPGYWVEFKGPYDETEEIKVDNFVHISCDGSIRYEIKEPYALIFKSSSDDGKIKKITDEMIEFKSWIGLSFKHHYRGPIKKEDGCYEISFKGKSFVASKYTDCTKAPPGLAEAFESMREYLKSDKRKNCY